MKMMRLVKYLKQNTTLVWTRMNRMLCPTKTVFKSLHTVLGCLLIPRGTSSSRRPHWTSFTSNRVKLRLIFTWRLPDIYLTFTWRLPNVHLTTWPPDHYLTFPWPSPDPYLTLIRRVQTSPEIHLMFTWPPDHYLTFPWPSQASQDLTLIKKV